MHNFKVKGCHLGNATICGISEKIILLVAYYFSQPHTFVWCFLEIVWCFCFVFFVLFCFVLFFF